jgi:hypothetical protein
LGNWRDFFFQKKKKRLSFQEPSKEASDLFHHASSNLAPS